MPEVKCLSSLIKALDATDPPPVTQEEKQAWVDEWREKERRLHTKKSEAEIAASMITVAEIDSILRTKHIRKEVQIHPRKGRRKTEPAVAAGDGWERVRVRRGGGPRNPAGTISVTKAGQVVFPVATVAEHQLTRFRSMDVYRKERVLRFDLRTDGEGDYKVNFASKNVKDRHLRCKRELVDLGVASGLYRVIVMQAKPLVLTVDLDDRVGDLELGRGCHVRRQRRA
jgi:hypothetical protein